MSDSEREQRILAKIKDAAAKILEEEGVDAEFVSAGVVGPDGEVTLGIGSDDGSDDEDDTDPEGFGDAFVASDAEVRAMAAEQGREGAFDEIAQLFQSIEDAHEHTTNGQDALAAIDKLAEGQPLRAFFSTARDKKSANAAVLELIDTADLRLLLEFLYELGKTIELLPKLQALLGRKLALRVTGHVLGKPVTEGMVRELEARTTATKGATKKGTTKGTKGDAKAELTEAMATLKRSIGDAKKKSRSAKQCDCAVCTARREHERNHLN